MSGERVPTSWLVFDRLYLEERCLPPAEMEMADLPIFRVIGLADEPAMLIGADLLRT